MIIALVGSLSMVFRGLFGNEDVDDDDYNNGEDDDDTLTVTSTTATKILY